MIETFDLPLPPGVRENELLSFQSLVGDYDGDGWRDVAVAMTWEDPDVDSLERGTLAVWLNPSLRDGQGTVLVPLPGAPGASAPLAEAPGGCGCATSAQGSAWLLLPLLALCRRR